jgi:hypothetical protein
MRRGGYDSVEAEEALRQGNLGPMGRLYHRLIGVPGWSGRASRVRLMLLLFACAAILSMFSGLYAYGAGPLSIVVLAACVVCAWSIGGRLMKPYGGGRLRGLLWGLCVAAVFLLLHQTVLSAMLSVWAWIHLGTWVGQARVASAATLQLAIPAWIDYPILGLLFRRDSDRSSPVPGRRKLLVPMFIVAAMIFMGVQGAYMDSLRR